MRRSHGTGSPPWNFRARGAGSVIEDHVLVFHPENISIGADVYVGHQTILKGYYRNEMIIEEGSWIGQQCFLHSAGGIFIGKHVGIGPGVQILTSAHEFVEKSEQPILHRPLRFAEVRVGDGSDIGVRSVILPGITLGRFVQVGAGSVVTKSFPDHSVIAGVPARLVRIEPGFIE